MTERPVSRAAQVSGPAHELAERAAQIAREPDVTISLP